MQNAETVLGVLRAHVALHWRAGCSEYAEPRIMPSRWSFRLVRELAGGVNPRHNLSVRSG
jgi:hypothetical protein